MKESDSGLSPKITLQIFQWKSALIALLTLLSPISVFRALTTVLTEPL